MRGRPRGAGCRGRGWRRGGRRWSGRRPGHRRRPGRRAGPGTGCRAGAATEINTASPGAVRGGGLVDRGVVAGVVAVLLLVAVRVAGRHVGAVRGGGLVRLLGVALRLVVHLVVGDLGGDAWLHRRQGRGVVHAGVVAAVSVRLFDRRLDLHLVLLGCGGLLGDVLDPGLGVGVDRRLDHRLRLDGGRLGGDRRAGLGGRFGGGLLGGSRGGPLRLLGLQRAGVRDGLDGRQHPSVAGAAAEVAAQRLPGLDLGGPVVALEQVVHGHRHAGGAVAALHGAGGGQRLLDVARGAPGRQALDGVDLAVGGQRGGHQAAGHQLAVHLHRAGPALALLAAVLGAGQSEPLAQHVEQALADPGVGDGPFETVDPQRVGGARAQLPADLRSEAERIGVEGLDGVCCHFSALPSARRASTDTVRRSRTAAAVGPSVTASQAPSAP